MSSRIYITDDGDEQVFIKINEELVLTLDHGQYGWQGMEEVIKMVEDLADAFGIPISNTQDIV